MSPVLRMSPSVRLCVVCLALFWRADAVAQQPSGVQATSIRPFVMSFTPVIGRGGVVGGVDIDADGVVSRVAFEKVEGLRETWLKTRNPIVQDLGKDTDLRMVSLKRLDRALAKLIASKEPPTEEMFFLAGLQRIHYVLVYPEVNDIVIAGPAGPWQVNRLGEVVSVKTRASVLRLDDLMDAMRSVDVARTEGIHCSIEPTEDGQKRFARLQSRRLTYSENVVRAMEQALGMQQVIVGGIAGDSHFARVMVVADYLMKRLAMGFEPATIAEMPSYLELMQRNPGRTKVTSPRWWLTTNYDPIQRSDDGLAWQIQGQGVKALTKDGLLNARGERTEFLAINPLAKRWADTMTSKYNELSKVNSVFGELRGCMDLAVAAALIANERLLDVAGCRLDVLLNEDRLQGPRYDVPKSTPSKASLVRAQRGWIVSVSGGVEINSWSVVQNVQTNGALAPTHRQVTPPGHDRWWW